MPDYRLSKELCLGYIFKKAPSNSFPDFSAAGNAANEIPRCLTKLNPFSVTGCIPTLQESLN
jgi:hypothetical protein